MRTKYCQFCGTRIKKLTTMSGSYHDNSCPEPSCPGHGDEQSDEFEGLTVFTPGEYEND